MAQSVNKAIIIGNVGRDPEVRHTTAGAKVVSFSIATTDTWKDKGGERQERTEWHRIVIFNPNLADVAEKYLKKGSKVYIEGQLQTRKWQDKDGTEKYSTEIVLGNFRGELALLDRQQGAGSGQSSGSSSSSGWDVPEASSMPSAGDPDDEIPF